LSEVDIRKPHGRLRSLKKPNATRSPSNKGKKLGSPSVVADFGTPP